MKPDVPPVPPELLPGRAGSEWLLLCAKWMLAAVGCYAVAVLAAILMWGAMDNLVIYAAAVAGMGCAVLGGRALLRSWQAIKREHEAGYTTYYGTGLDYWQLEVKTGKVLRRPGEQTVHREGIPRETLRAEEPTAIQEVALERPPDHSGHER